jgi:hypothetical protein
MTQTRQIYTLEDLYEQRFAPLSTLNLERVSATIQAYAAFLAKDMSEQLDLFTEETTEPRAIWGGAANIGFEEVGEFGKGKTRKDTRGQELHFPLYKLDATVGGSEEFWKRASVKNLIDVMTGMQNGYAERVRDEVKAAVFNSAIRTPVKDWLKDNSSLNLIQPFLNADSREIPIAPNGTSFTASSHQHYVGTSGTAVSTYDINTLVANVREHVLGKVVLFVDSAMPTTLAAMAGTLYYPNTPIVLSNQSTSLVSNISLDPSGDSANQFVGIWGNGIEVHTRSWVPTGYIACMAIGGQLGKPLWRRVDPMFPGLITGLEISDGRVRVKESYFYMGFGAFNRAAGAVLDTLHQTNYTAPSGLIRS